MAIKCCNKCPEREVGCHAWCERYEREKEKHENQKLRNRRRKEENSSIDEVQYNSRKGKYNHNY